MDWTYIEKRRWKHHQSCTGLESTKETEEGAPHRELEENVHVSTEGKNIIWMECKTTGKEQRERERDFLEKIDDMQELQESFL